MHATKLFMCKIGICTQILMLAKQALCSLSHFPSPHSTCIYYNWDIMSDRVNSREEVHIFNCSLRSFGSITMHKSWSQKLCGTALYSRWWTGHRGLNRNLCYRLQDQSLMACVCQVGLMSQTVFCLLTYANSWGQCVQAHKHGEGHFIFKECGYSLRM